MHNEVREEKPGKCPLCGMDLVPLESTQKQDTHPQYIKPLRQMGFWEKMKIGMSMSMGMEHGGIAGREMAKLMEEDIRNKFFFALIFTIPIVLYSQMGKMLLSRSLPSPIPVQWLLFILTTPVFFYAGWLFLYSAFKALQVKVLNMSVLIAIGITAAYGFSFVLTLIGSSDSYYEAAAMLITFVLFGHWMEMKSRRGTTDALQALFNLVPSKARLWINDKESLIPTSEVKLSDILLLKPGDKVPVDGVITEGETAIDESLVTGESIPVNKTVGDEVIGGSINTAGAIKFKATKVGEDTVLAQIVKMVEIAQNSKAPGQKLADRFAKYLVILAVGGGFVTFIVWFFILNQPLLTALSFAISTIVIACPDALGLATPTAVAVGTGLGAKHNILIKDAPTLEQLSKIQAIVLDKTGTLTEGRPIVVDIIAAKPFTKQQVLQLVASVETKSNHPLSRAVLSKLKESKLVLSKVEGFKSLSGLGIEAKVEGKHILVGTIKL
jgi:Cu2+-exporting ATPase